LNRNGMVVEVEKLPKCDFCASTAQYDTRTRTGPWAWTCKVCYDKHGVGRLGTGHGQKLVLQEGLN